MYDLIIDCEGNLTTIYSDDIVDLLKEGNAVITRASTVEPDANGEWVADLAPINGPKLPACALRSEALAAEVRWLSDNLHKL